MKDRLKARGYRWNRDEATGPKAWYIDVAEPDRETELAHLPARSTATILA